MAKGHIPVPDELKAFLEIEDCSDFDLKKYFITPDNQMLFDTIVREKKLGDQLRERFHINYLMVQLLTFIYEILAGKKGIMLYLLVI